MKSKNTILISALALVIGIFLGYFIASYQKSGADYWSGFGKANPIPPIKCEFVKMFKNPNTGEWEYGGCLTQ